jgi:hypothetical protein
VEEDGEEVDARWMGRRSPEAGAGQGGSRPHSGSRRRRTGGVARGEGVGGSLDRRRGGRPAVVENPREQRTGGTAEGGGGEDDGGGGGGGHDDDDGGGSGMKMWPSAGGRGSLLLYIYTPLVPGRVMKHDKRGPFVTVGEATRD